MKQDTVKADTELTDKIESASKWSNRYELDLHLMQAGYSPEQIDVAWQTIRSRQLKQNWLTSNVQKLFAGFAVMWVCVNSIILPSIGLRLNNTAQTLTVLGFSILNILVCGGIACWLLRSYIPHRQSEPLQGMFLTFIMLLMLIAGTLSSLAAIVSVSNLLGNY